MTKHVIKKSTSLTLAILIAVIALAIPALIVRAAIVKSGEDSSGMEQNRSRAPSLNESSNPDLPEGLLDLENNQVGRGIDQPYIDTDIQSDSKNKVILQTYPEKDTNDIPANSLVKAAGEGDENAKQSLRDEAILHLRKNSDEAEEYFSNLLREEEAKNVPVTAPSITTAATTKVTKATQAETTQASAAATTGSTTTTTAPTTAATTTAPTTAAPVTTPPTTAALPATSGQFLLSISNPDPNYVGRPVQVEDRAVLEGLVMGEFGNDYTGAVLVAQAIRDTMNLTGTYNTAQIARQWGYTAAIHNNVTDATKRAVAFVFDEGGSAVQHTVYYFYAAHLIYSPWHESQRFVVQHGGCRFFSR